MKHSTKNNIPQTFELLSLRTISIPQQAIISFGLIFSHSKLQTKLVPARSSVDYRYKLTSPVSRGCELNTLMCRVRQWALNQTRKALELSVLIIICAEPPSLTLMSFQFIIITPDQLKTVVPWNISTCPIRLHERVLIFSKYSFIFQFCWLVYRR